MTKNCKLSIQCFYGVNKGKKRMQYTVFIVLSKLMRAANCVQFCLNPFSREIHEGCLPHDKIDSDKTVHNVQLTSAWIRS